jgi:UDP-N-acetylglucosamine--N-acetylmuramyl-(pentapeptide) pyrophosphoryl-undecaprenol N-acetylglucosamine transferase
VFLVSDRPLDAQILKREGAEFRVIPAKPMGLRPRALVRFLGSWGASIRQTRAAIRELREAGTVQMVAMGGFVAAPAVQAARAERVPITMVNMDAVPGKANRWIARRASRVVTSAPTPGYSWERIPPIVRASAMARGSKAENRVALGLHGERKTLLVTGGSQGARSINQLLTAMVKNRREAFAMWQVIHQTGGREDDAVNAAYQEAGIQSVVRPFFEDMGQAWGGADLAVSRAGAGSVAEAWTNRVPTVFLPYPFHRDLHQRHNAGPLVEAGACVLATDHIEPGLNLREAGALIETLLTDLNALGRLQEGYRNLGPADGAERVAQLILDGP